MDLRFGHGLRTYTGAGVGGNPPAVVGAACSPADDTVAAPLGVAQGGNVGSVRGRNQSDRLEAAALRLLLGTLGSLPEPVSVGLASGVTRNAGRFAGRLRDLGLANLEIAFPEKDEAWRRETLRGTFDNLGRLAGEFAHFADLNADNIRDRVGFASPADEQRWREGVVKGPCVVATGHFGNWEMFAQAQGYLGHPISLVYRKMKNPLVDAYVGEIRARAGTRMLAKRSAARELLQRLRRGELVALPIDQHEPQGHGFPVPFFGRPASTTLGPARLAQLVQAPLQVAVMARVGRTNQHEIIVQEPIAPPPRREKDPALLISMMTKVNASYEECIRRHPSQWLWIHRRWRD